MFYCKNCQRLFEEFRTKTEYGYHSELDLDEPYERIDIACCPSCGSDDLEEAEQCPVCNAPLKGYQRLCSNCFNVICEGVDLMKAKTGATTEKVVDGIEAYLDTGERNE